MSSPKRKFELLFLCLSLTGFAVLLSCSNDDESFEDTAYFARSSVNEAPNAEIYVYSSVKLQVTSEAITGTAPLGIRFNSRSTDDNGIKGYSWDFGSGIAPSTLKVPKRTFNDPGIYTVKLTVYDAEGLTSTDTVTITLTGENEETTVSSPETEDTVASTAAIDCATGGGYAGDTGAKVWCWDTIDIPDYSGTKGVGFSNKELYVDSQCYEEQVTIEGNRMKFRIDPTSNVGDWCSEDYNMRAEIRTAPWDIRHPKGTEEWFGWDYTFGNDYIIDKNSQWLFFQVHNAVRGLPPHIELMVIKDNQFNGHSAGEIYVVNNATSGTKYNPTGITPRAGNKLDIVVHTIWGDSSNGKFQVWINGSKVYDKQEATIYSAYPWAGNAKWGIYKWPWRNDDGVSKSLQQGLTHMETSMGTLRMITRKPGDTDYGKDSYSKVFPN